MERLLKCCQTEPDQFKNNLKEILTPEQITFIGKDVGTCLRMVPDIDLKLCWRTVDEDDIFENDVVTITVKLTRLAKPWEHQEPRSSSMEIPEVELRKKGLTKDDEYEDLEFDKKRRFGLTSFDAPIVHSYSYPYQLREKWMVMLYDKIPEGYFLMRAKAIPALTGTEDMEFRFQAPAVRVPQLTKTLGIRLMCDSYVGCDKFIEFEVTVKQRPEEIVEELKEKQEYNIPEESIWDQSDPKWYYLWCDSFLEMVCTLILLFLMFVALLQSRFGKKHVQPWVDWVWKFVDPHYSNILKPHVVLMNEYMEDKGIDFSWMWDEEVAKEVNEQMEEEERRREQAERLSEEMIEEKEKNQKEEI